MACRAFAHTDDSEAQAGYPMSETALCPTAPGLGGRSGRVRIRGGEPECRLCIDPDNSSAEPSGLRPLSLSRCHFTLSRHCTPTACSPGAGRRCLQMLLNRASVSRFKAAWVPPCGTLQPGPGLPSGGAGRRRHGRGGRRRGSRAGRPTPATRWRV